MLTSTVFHEDVFFEFFRPFRHPSSRFNIWGGIGLETFGSDLELVRGYSENFVWTVLDGCEGPDQWIVPGVHYVNRICYLLTEVEHDDLPVEFRVALRPRPITQVGLTRRINALRKLIQVNSALSAEETT